MEDFTIEGPDADGFVWLYSKDGHKGINLGKLETVVEKMSQWLAEVEG